MTGEEFLLKGEISHLSMPVNLRRGILLWKIYHLTMRLSKQKMVRRRGEDLKGWKALNNIFVDQKFSLVIRI